MNRDVLVIGGGIAGIQSALLLAEKNHKVYMIDNAPAIGGYFPLLERTFPTNSCGICFMSPKPPAYCPIYENEFHDNIDIISNCDIQEVSGKAGNFTVSYSVRPGYVDGNKCDKCKKCEEACPVEVKRKLGGGLEIRKAIFLPFMQAIPHYYSIDEKACTKCGECLKVCSPGAINLEAKVSNGVLEVGAIILGFGFEQNPGNIRSEYGFGRYKNVLSSIQYERMLSFSSTFKGQPVRLSDKKKIKKLAFIQCAGSRDISCDRGYCSSVCCRIATKQSMISKLRSEDLEITIFYMDIRAMGKGYEKYYTESKEKYKIRYIRSAVSSLRELQSSKNLLITYGSDNGELMDEEFDAVVLSLGFTPPLNIKNISKNLGVKLNEYGFCETEEFHPTETSVPGIFVAGAFREPRDIPESVVDACSAVADVSMLLDNKLDNKETERETETAIIDDNQSINDDDELRLGIFVCDKHNIIKKQLDLVEILGELGMDKEIIRLKRVDFTVMETGLLEVKDLIEEHNLNRVIIAGYRCLEINRYIKTHTSILGAYSNLISLANIGEQCANVHKDNPISATKKAYSLILASMETAKLNIPRKRGKKTLNRRVLVIGGGISGLSCCLSLAEQGMDVTLIEKEVKLGGNARFIYYTLKGFDVQKLLKDIIDKVEKHPDIEIYKDSKLVKLDGTWGSFCSVIHTRGKSETEIKHGAVIFAVGGHEIKPEEYLFGEDPNVITQREFERMIFFKEKNIDKVKTIAMIQCVNCRNDSHPYCSRICCIHAVKNALKLKELNPDVNIYILYRDIRTYGFYEKYYLLAREKGIIFIRYEEQEKPQVRFINNRLELSFFDRLISENIKFEPEFIVLSNGIEPNNNIELALIADIEMTKEGFFAEANPKSAPLDSIDRGKFFCGICHSPNLLENVICQGKAAAARASVLLWNKESYFADSQAFVKDRKCTGCGICISACPFNARSINPVTNKAVVKEDICKGCGICVAACKNGASQQYDFEKKEIIRELDQILV